MALPPERISIKRRRIDDPVDTLVLDPGNNNNNNSSSNTHDKKRRFTDFIFQRLKSGDKESSHNVHEKTIAAAASDARTAAAAAGSSTKARSQAEYYSALGIPLVRATLPGDESKEYDKYDKSKSKTAPTVAAARHVKSTHITHENQSTNSKEKNGDAMNGIPMEKVKSARRFHLTRDISSALRPNSSGGIRRRKLNLRPPLATFVEKQSAQPKSVNQQGPVDSIVHVNEGKDHNSDVSQVQSSILPVTRSKTTVKTFTKPAPALSREGHSIHDDPSTWDVESDQLADELAALAFELDPDATSVIEVEETVKSQTLTRAPEPMIVDSDDDFVFETYVRVRRDANPELNQAYFADEIGILVINDEEYDLWEKYIREDDDDDDDDWDEEDEDSNAEDNPRNDYPEDEVSSDDEFGHNVYKYRQNTSDDEQHDSVQGW